MSINILMKQPKSSCLVATSTTFCEYIMAFIVSLTHEEIVRHAM